MIKVLLVADGITMAHVTRMEQLAKQLDLTQFEIHFATSSNYFSLLSLEGIAQYPLHAIHSVSTAEFNKRLYETQFPWTREELTAQLYEDLKLIEQVNPDLVIGDTRLSLGVACARKSKMYFNLTNFHWSNTYPHKNHVPHVKTIETIPRNLANFVSPAITPFILHQQKSAVNKWLKSVDAPTVKTIFDFYTQGNFLLFPDTQSLYDNYTIPKNGLFIGPLIWSGNKIPWPAHWKNIEPKAAKWVTVSMGSSGNSDLVPRIVNALTKIGYDVLVSGKHPLLENSTNPRIHQADFLPMNEVLKLSSLVICNGGTGSSYHFLSKATPFFSFPTNLDQVINVSHLKKQKLTDYLHISHFSEKKFIKKLQKMIQDPNLKDKLNETKEQINKSIQKNSLNDFLANAYRNKSDQVKAV